MQPRVLSSVAALGVVILGATALSSHAATNEAAAPNGAKQPPATTATPTLLGGAQGWNAYVDNEKKGKLCYLVGKPAKSQPATLKRGTIHALVTHRPTEKSTNVVSFVAGYTFKEHSDVELEIDGRKFSLFTDKDTAWARDAATDKAIVEALSKAKQAVIKGTPAHGSATTDSYTLAGFNQALAQIDKACGVKR